MFSRTQRSVFKDGRFDKIKEYQDCWEEALILETKAQFISEACKAAQR